ncbi:glucose-6-phosphate isomerase [Leuconostocaceae bacterium ESL0958]|nr:glucose-6-phosphate isomerase [Leuconostocaceae bacterium ESL0958]
MTVAFDRSGLEHFIQDSEWTDIQTQIEHADQQLRAKTGVGARYTDWLHLPSTFTEAELTAIQHAAQRIQQQSRVLVVIGIGGSYLGAKMALDFVKSKWHNDLVQDQECKVYFAGNSLSAADLKRTMQVIGKQDFSVNVISKSGTTTEPALAFRFFRKELVARYGEVGANQRIYATTDGERGALHDEALSEGYERFVIPDGVGGRFSVLTAVGLLPMAAAGIDIEQVLAGAKEAEGDYQSKQLADNPALQYAAARRILYDKGYHTEILANWEPSLQYLGEWWKQLMGESEGKNQKGIYPSSANYSTDLHSIGQYIQEGRRDLFETVVRVEQEQVDATVPVTNQQDGLAYLEGRQLSTVNQTAALGVALAHIDGGVPNMAVTVAIQDAFNLGELIYFFELAVGISGYLFAINPFNQPGVEAYKTAMFALLNKPGYEAASRAYAQRLQK